MKKKEMTKEQLQHEEQLDLYDKIIAHTLKKYMEYIDVCGFLDIGDFDPDDTEHKTIMQIALLACTFTNKKLYVKTNLFNYLKFKKEIKGKTSIKIKRSVPGFHEFMNINLTIYDICKEFNVSSSILSDIFKEYYDKKGEEVND